MLKLGIANTLLVLPDQKAEQLFSELVLFVGWKSGSSDSRRGLCYNPVVDKNAYIEHLSVSYCFCFLCLCTHLVDSSSFICCAWKWSLLGRCADFVLYFSKAVAQFRNVVLIYRWNCTKLCELCLGATVLKLGLPKWKLPLILPGMTLSRSAVITTGLWEWGWRWYSHPSC